MRMVTIRSRKQSILQFNITHALICFLERHTKNEVRPSLAVGERRSDKRLTCRMSVLQSRFSTYTYGIHPEIIYSIHVVKKKGADPQFTV